MNFSLKPRTREWDIKKMYGVEYKDIFKVRVKWDRQGMISRINPHYIFHRNQFASVGEYITAAHRFDPLVLRDHQNSQSLGLLFLHS
jgi:hypothetical protein